MTNITAQSTVETVKPVALVGYVQVEIDTTGIDVNDPQAVLEAAKRQLPGHFKNDVEWRIDEVSEYC